MASINKKTTAPAIHTHGGAIADRITPFQQLRRSVMATMLFEKEFYEDGQDIYARIAKLIPQVGADKVAQLAIDTRSFGNLRHVPLAIVREMARLPSHRHLVANTLTEVVQRADELTEFLALYWKDGKTPISAQVKKGLAQAFTKFNEYALAKYNRDKDITLRDVLFLSHARPKDAAQAAIWKKLINDELAVPDTWEVELSKSSDKKASWTRLLAEKKLGALALLRNLRNMTQAGVERSYITAALANTDYSRVLPFRFIAAARHAPEFESELESAMMKCIESLKKFSGRTLIVVDVSGSMDAQLSAKSDMTRLDAACGVAMILRELCDDVGIYSFSNNEVLVPNRRGFALRDAIVKSQHHSGTDAGRSLKSIFAKEKTYDRLVVITDEQSSSRIPTPASEHTYMINVASYKNGIGYGSWTHIDGFSEAVIKFMSEFEGM